MARPGDFEVSVEGSSDGSATVVRVDGDLDMATCPELTEALAGIELGKRTVVDVSGCTFLDSCAVRVLVASARIAASAGGEIVLVTQDPGILRVLEIASVDTMLAVHETVEAAGVTQRQ